MENYDISYTKKTLTVGKKALEVLAVNQNKEYGSLYTYAGTEFTTSGLVNGNTVTSASITSDGAVATAVVNTYDINIASALGTGLENYEITYTKKTLTVGKKDLVITANNQSKTYGDTKVLGTTLFTAPALESFDAITGVTLTSSGAVNTATVAGSTYPIVASAATGTGLGNYTITYANGSLTVGKKALLITAGSQSKTYGETKVLGTTAFTAPALESSDSITGVTLSSSGAVNTATVAGSTYPIVASATSGTGLGNYTITYADGALTVTKAALTITASNQPLLCGQAIPVFIGTYSGEKNNEQFVIGGTCTATSSSGVGTYPITPSVSGSTLSNYDVSRINGTLTISGVNIDANANVTPKPVSPTTATLVMIKVTNTSGVAASGVLVTLYVDDRNAVTSYTTDTGIANFNLGILAADVYRLRAVAGSGCAETTVYMPVYDPTGGFITGGGWITSPIYTDLQYMNVGGKANFGFVSKYEKGRTVPSGNTEFQFKEGGMNFSSTSFDWLVISGKKAQYKGTGTINGAGTFGFILTAIDGNLASPPTVDLFRIKIYNKSTNAVVYDNQYGATADDADPITALGGGSIVIHEVKKNTTTTKTEEIANKTTEISPFNAIAYPNPSNQYFNIEMKGGSTEKVDIMVYDVLGKTIKHIESSDGQFIRFGEELPTGVYIAVINQGMNQKTIRLIKQ